MAVVKLNFAAIKEGHSCLELDVASVDIDLAEFIEFAYPVHIVHHLDKVSNEIYVKTTLSTSVNLECDVCLDSYKLDLRETIDTILTKDSELVDRGEEEVYLISDSTTEIDITDSIRQSLLLAIPYKKICRENCKGLCPICGVNFNHEQCTCANEKTDSRWEALKNITFENK
ncbi:DUF177 domain-containing protein [candidate division KSB1 bacterium]|nr:DUF177 domain-containing protein [candidate division KSB1 bacterium]